MNAPALNYRFTATSTALSVRDRGFSLQYPSSIQTITTNSNSLPSSCSKEKFWSGSLHTRHNFCHHLWLCASLGEPYTAKEPLSFSRNSWPEEWITETNWSMPWKETPCIWGPPISSGYQSQISYQSVKVGKMCWKMKNKLLSALSKSSHAPH